MTDADRAAFFAIHSGLMREGPGDEASLRRMLARAGVAPDAVLCDAGCGPGADVPALLAHVPQGRVDAVDLHAPFIAALAARHGDTPRLRPILGDMAALPGRYDLIWSAGAVYNLGIGPALAAFRRALKPGGRIAFSNLCWLTETRPPEAVAFWAEEYPEMQDMDADFAAIAAAGAKVIRHEVLGAAAWQAYYGPLEARLDRLEADGDAGAGAVLARHIADHRREIAIWRGAAGSYGYVLWLVEFGAT